MLTVAAGASLAASSPPELASLFPRRAEIFVDRPGLSRLPLPPEVIAQCRPDLSDLRILDLGGREIPYLVDSGPPPDLALEARTLFEPRLLEALQEVVERESMADLRRETYRLSLPAGEPRAWDLVIESRQERFVRRVEVTVVPDGGDELPVWEGSMFRLLEPRREKLAASLPALRAGSLEVTLEGEETFFVEPSFRFVASRLLPEQELLRIDLAVVSVVSHGGSTVVELERPRGLVPDRLAVETATGSFNRRIEIRDLGAGGEGEVLGSGILYRLEGADIARTELALAAARGDRLQVVIEDGDSPPLNEVGFRAILRRPSVVFSLGLTGSEEAAGYLLYGGGRAHRPRYDLAGLVAAERRRLAGEEARIAAELHDTARLPPARLGPSAANPLWDPAPALAFAMRPGTRLASWPFRYRRSLSVPETSDGLLRLGLDAATLARCRSDLADLRVVDAESRQWPYLIDRSGPPQRVALEVGEAVTAEGRSIYELTPPAVPLRLEEILLDGPAPFFDRPFEIAAVRPGRGDTMRTVTRGRLSRRPDAPGQITLPMGGMRVTALELRVQDGDDPPLEWSMAEARVAQPALLFAAPRGNYTLLFGEADARQPSYELEQVRELVLAVGAADIEAGELIENPQRGAFARFRGEGGWQQVVLWVVLVGAALFLAWLTLKLARQEPEPR
jgi:hypothetical protein